MDTLKLLLWLAIMAVAVQEVSCKILEDKKKPKGCVVGVPRDCSSGNYTFKCRQPQIQPENGGKACPPQIDIPDPLTPDQHYQLCEVGAWGECEQLPGYRSIWVRRRAPLDPTSDISTCPQLVELCYITEHRIDCVMTDWSEWYDFPAHGISARVRFIIIEPQNGGAACPHDIETRPIGGGCNYGQWSNWIPQSGYCYRSRTSSGQTGCTAIREYKSAPCGISCNYGQWGNWMPQSGYCYRQRTSSGQTGCTDTREYKSAPCYACTYTQWSNWMPTGSSGYCYRTRSATSSSSTCTDTYDTERCAIACTYTQWSTWMPTGSSGYCYRTRSATSSSSTCTDTYDTERCAVACNYGQWGNWFPQGTYCIRYRTTSDQSICPDTSDTKSAPCGNTCDLAPPGTQAAGVREGPAGTRRKRDLPWCPEEEWIIYGRDDGCMAIQNVSWFKCLEDNCQNCLAPAGKSLICIQDKYTTLRIPLDCGNDLVVTRPMACTCYEDYTCDKFMGPCRDYY